MKTIASTAMLSLLLAALEGSWTFAADPNLAPPNSDAGSAVSTDLAPAVAPAFGAPLLPVPPSPNASPIVPANLAGGEPPMPSGPQGVSPTTPALPPGPSVSAPAGNIQIGDVPGKATVGAPMAGPSSSPLAGNAAYQGMDGHVTMSDAYGQALSDPFPPIFYLNGYFGDAPGWHDPSYQVDLYYPWHIVPGRSAIITAAQGAVTNYGTGYINAGVGYRELNPDWNRIWGVWGWFDWDDSNHHNWGRGSFSVESLGQYFDVRGNGYFLIRDKAALISDEFVGSPFFSGFNILMNRQMVTENAFGGFDAEVGGPLPFVGRHGINGYVGPYYLHSDVGGHTWGVQGRINVNVTDNFQVNVSMQHDEIFNTTTFVQVSLALPDGTPTKWFQPQCLADRLGSMVIRKDRIPVRQELNVEGVALLNPPGPPTPGNPPNPRAGLPIVVIHVDPNKPAGTGDGSAENPFGTLEQARQINNAGIDLFDIRPRTDNTGTNLVMSAPFSLFDYQRVWGTTVSHSLPTASGTFVVPATDSGLSKPLVSNGNITPTSSVFVMANVNEISGLHISGVDSTGTVYGNGISNNVAIVDFNINQNDFSNYLNGVALVNATGDGSSLHLSSNNVSDNTFTGTSGVSQNGFSLVNSNPGSTTVSFTNNTATNNGANGFFVQVSNAAATANLDFENNTSTGNGTGYFISAAPGTINLDFNNNVGSSNTASSTGVHVQAAGGTVNVNSFTNNTITGNAGDGVWFDANSNLGGGATSTINVTNFFGNLINANGTAAIGPIGSDPDGLLMSVQGANSFIHAQIGDPNQAANTITNNGAAGIGGAGIHLFLTGGGTIDGSIVNNIINNNVSFGIHVDAQAGNVGEIGTSPSNAGANPYLITQNTISGNGDAGIFVRLQNDVVNNPFTFPSSAGFTITQNSITGQVDGPNTLAAGEGIHFRTEGASFLWQADIQNNFIGVTSTGSAAGNASHGIEFEALGDSKMADNVLFPATNLVTIKNNTIQFNGGDGINFQRGGDALVDNVVIQTNTITNNAANGINLQIGGGATDISTGGHLTVDFLINQGNNISSNGIDGIDVHALASADLRATIDGNTIVGNTRDGINAQAMATAEVEGNWTNNQINNNGRFGIAFTDLDDSFVTNSFNVLVANNTIQGNVSDGINYSTQLNVPAGGGTGFVTINDNLIKGNGGNGVTVDTIGTAVAHVDLNSNLIHGNTGDGVRLFASDQSQIVSTIANNIIENNGGDGVSITTALTSPTSILQTSQIAATLRDDIIRFNGGRGVNILNQWQGQMEIQIIGSVNPNTVASSAVTSSIDSNGLQGILVTNEADATLSFADGVLTDNTINFTLFQTAVRGNGTHQVTADDGDGLLLNVGTSQFGAVNASVENNRFSGNANIDVVAQSFVATANPPVAAAVNSDGTFNGGHIPDPVARLNLRLMGNVGDSIDITRRGAAYGGASNPSDAFKSVQGTFADPEIPAGQYSFDSIAPTRLRNAQRDPVDAYALRASPTTPDSVAATPAPSTTSFGSNNGIISADGDYVNAAVEGIEGVRRVISTTTASTQTITVSAAYPAAPAVGTPFTVRAYDQSGVGESTFRTDSGPSVLTHNTFTHVLSDFSTQIQLDPNPADPHQGDEIPFTYTWTTGAVFGSPFPP